MKKQIMTGLIGAASLLAMAATGAHAYDWPKATCTAGKINIIKAGAVSYDNWTNSCNRMITMTCTAGSLLGGSTTSVTGTYCVHSGVDSDGILATALTAQDDGTKVVQYDIYDYTNTPGVWGNGLLLSLSLVTGQ